MWVAPWEPPSVRPQASHSRAAPPGLIRRPGGRKNAPAGFLLAGVGIISVDGH